MLHVIQNIDKTMSEINQILNEIRNENAMCQTPHNNTAARMATITWRIRSYLNLMLEHPNLNINISLTRLHFMSHERNSYANEIIH